MKVQVEGEVLGNGEMAWGVLISRDRDTVYIPCEDRDDADVFEERLTRLIWEWSAECVFNKDIESSKG